MKWEDVTSYSRGADRVPTAWRLSLTSDVSITVVRDHLQRPGEWVVHCRPWFDTTPLGMTTTEHSAVDAQRRALAMVRKRVGELSSALA